MKAAIVTFVRAYNYGAVLQCYALSQALKELGVDVEVIDYYPQYFKDLYSLSYLGKMRLLPYRPIRNWIKFTPVLLAIKKRNRGFESFLARHIPLTKRQYATQEEINEENFEYDIYISGSDQVWSNSCVPFDPVYFLTFPSVKNGKKCSYAASFGFQALPEGFESVYKERLTGWDAYSVREKSGVEILRKLLGVQATQCCDPTLLLTKSQWDGLRKKTVKRKPYILIYIVNRTQELYEYGKRLSQEKGLPVICLSSNMHHDRLMGYEAHSLGFRAYGSASPDEWLELFAEAEYVLSDSFHGTVFSILNHKKFLTQLKFPWGRNNRAEALLDALKMRDRELAGNVNCIDNEIDWDTIESLLQDIRSGSIAYLKELTTEGENNHA